MSCIAYLNKYCLSLINNGKLRSHHLTINDSPTCQIKIRNNTTTPLTLKMTATLNGLNATIDTTHQVPPRAQGVGWDKENTVLKPGETLNATLHLFIAHAMMPPQDFHFITQVTITGTP
jgi:hypothetical protein